MVFDPLVVFTEQVLQIISLILLRIKPFIFYFPAHPPLLHQIAYVLFSHRQTCQKTERLFFLTFDFAHPSFYGPFQFLTILHQIDFTSVIVNLIYIIIPVSAIFYFRFLSVLFQVFQFSIFLSYCRDTSLLKSDQILPPVFPAFPEKWLTCIQAVRT